MTQLIYIFFQTNLFQRQQTKRETTALAVRGGCYFKLTTLTLTPTIRNLDLVVNKLRNLDEVKLFLVLVLDAFMGFS